MNLNTYLPKATDRKKPCCKNRKQPWFPGALDTTYRENFTEKEVPREPPKPKGYSFQDPPAPFDGTTTQKVDFKPWQVPREGPIKPANTIAKADAPFEADTMYKTDFGPKETRYERVRPPNAFQPNPAPFDGTTTQKADYQPKGVPAPPPPITKGTNIPTSSGPFEGSSLYKDTFQRWPMTKREPVPAAKGSSNVFGGGPFDGTTMYRASYVPKEIGPRETSARPQQEDHLRDTPRHYDEVPSTEYKSNYVGKDVPSVPVRSVKPTHPLMPSAPFDGTTTQKTDYIPFGIPSARSRAARPQPALQVEKQPFQAQSTYRDTFVPLEAPYQRVRPQNAFQPNPAPFDGTTTHKATYIPFSVPQNRPLRAPQSALNQEKHPFQGQSTYKDDFIKMPGGLRAERKIMQGGQHESGPFDGTTTYRKDFVPKDIPARETFKPDEDCYSCDSDPNCID